VTLYVFNDLLLNIDARISLALGNLCSYLILALAAANSSWGFKAVTILPLEVFIGPAATLPVAVFLSIVVIALYNFRFFRGSSLYTFSRFYSILLGSVFFKVYFILKVLFYF